MGVREARDRVASARRGPHDHQAIHTAQLDLLTALEAYVECLAGAGASVHLTLRSEVDLLRRVTRQARY